MPSKARENDPFIGLRFGEKEELVVVRLLGRGGSGTIYLAWDEAHQRTVALKFLNAHLSSNSIVLARFVREGKLFGSLEHPNLVRVWSFGQAQGRLFIVSEYVAGMNLYQILKREGPLPTRRALEICKDVAAGLAEAHRAAIVHRDLKPENIMIRIEDGAVRVLDFGIAKDLNSSSELTQLGTYIGTPAYSAPEQIRGSRVDGRADIFSLGVILYELLTGKLAFEGRHSTEILRATLKDEPVPVRALNQDVTEPVARLIQRMIEKEPRMRFQSMKEVIAATDRVLAATPAEASVEEQTGIRMALKELFER